MAVRKDSVQIDITFLTDENRQFAKLNQSNKQLVRDLRTAKKEGGDLAGVIQNIARQGKAVEGLDLTKVAPAELLSRARTLRTILQQIPESAPQYAKLQGEYKRINDRLAEIRQSTRGVVAESSRMGKVLRGALSVFGGISLAGIASSIVNLGKGIFNAGTNFQKFEAILTNTLGSRSEANRVLKDLQDFAARTPFQLEELTQSYIKLVNRGIKPSQEELTLLGDIAASQGKSFDQLTEAILDATTGEFERLKEFGIRAKKDGDVVQLAFKGMTKEVANTEDAIAQAILDFGKLEGVVGSMASVAQTRGGLVSNFFDNINKLFTNLSNGVIGRVFDSMLRGLNSVVGSLVRFTDKANNASDGVRELQTQFNIEIETLKRGELSQKNRIKLIEQINTKYGEYLPNLLSEKSSLEDIAAAQQEANKAFLIRINFLVAEERLRESVKRRQELEENEIALQKRLTVAREEAAAAEEKLRKRQQSGPQFGGVNVNENVAIGRLDGLETEIRNNQRLKEQLDQEIQDRTKRALDLGVDISNLFSGEDSGIGNGGGGSAGYDPDKALDTRLKGIEAFIARQKLLLERSLLEKEISESDHNKRLLEIERDRYRQQLDAFDLYNQSQNERAEEALNEIIKINQQLNRDPSVVATLPGDGLPAGVERRGINAGLDAVAEKEENNLDRLRSAFMQALITEKEYEISKLELRRDSLAAEIELLRQGTDEEVAEANRRAEQLKEIDFKLFQYRRDLDDEEQRAKENLFGAVNGFWQDSINFASQLLSEDEKTRKKQISVIKAFQSGQIISSGIAEIQKIWEKAADFGPFQTIVAGIQTAASSVRTASAIARLRKTEFKAERGIQMGTFGGNRHSHGGTKGYFEDGTRIEVEKDENFVVLNRRSSAMLRALSDLNVAGGGRSFVSAARSGFRFATGGMVNTTPIPSRASLLPGGGGDSSALLGEFRAVRDLLTMWPQTVRAQIVYTELETADSDVSSVRAAASV